MWLLNSPRYLDGRVHADCFRGSGDMNGMGMSEQRHKHSGTSDELLLEMFSVL